MVKTQSGGKKKKVESEAVGPVRRNIQELTDRVEVNKRAPMSGGEKWNFIHLEGRNWSVVRGWPLRDAAENEPSGEEAVTSRWRQKASSGGNYDCRYWKYCHIKTRKKVLL